MKPSHFRIRNGFNSSHKTKTKQAQNPDSQIGENHIYVPSCSSVGYDETSNQNNGDAFLKLFTSVMGSLEQLAKSPLMRRSDLEVRDRSYLLQIPNGKSFQKSKQILKKWIQKMISDIVSIAFNYFSNDQFTYEQAKIYCSQNILSNIAALVKQYKLTAAELKEVDDFIRDDVLQLLSKKYPMTESIVVNRALEAIAKAPDLSEKLQNDFFSMAKITFEQKEGNGFSTQIKSTINTIINHINEENSLVKHSTNFQVFQKLMTKIFQFVEESDWMIASEPQRSDALSSFLYQLQYKDPMTSSTKIKESVFSLQSDSSKREYRQKVKQYTSYLIGRKVSENTPSFTEEEMASNRIQIKSTAILRILTKWCEQLWQKFIPKNYYMNKTEDFRLLNGEIKSVSLEMRSNLDKLMQAQKVQIKAFMAKVTNDNYDAQINLLNQLLENSDDQFWQKNLEKISEKFSVLIGKSLEKWVVKYLNRLMEGLTNVSNEFYNKFFSREWPCPPNLITFKIGDLMRCKCSSGQREIRYIFQLIKWVSDSYPEILSITRIKNRLSLGTNDILMNVKFCESIICEIQLAVNSKKSKFIKSSNVMSHYLYEIQRSLFGPINQLGSIWRSLDLRATYFDKNLGGGKSAGSHRCQSQKKAFQFQVFDAPFICSLCNSTYSQNTMIIKHVKCSQCSYWKCALCQIKQIPSQKLTSMFIPDVQLRKMCEKKILFQDDVKELPNFGVSVHLESGHKSQVLVYKKIEVRGVNYLFARQSGQLKLLLKITHDGAEMQYLKQHLVFQLNAQNGTNLIQLTQEQANQEYFLPLHITDCYKNRKNAITLENQPVDSNNSRFIFKGSQESQQAITSLSLTNTRLEMIQPLDQFFPNLTQLNLYQNAQLTNFDNIPLFLNLKELRLKNSSLLYQIPQAVFKLHLLVKLDIKDCIFVTLPPGIGELKNLKIFNFSHSEQFAGKRYIRQLPKELYELSQLEELNFEYQAVNQLDEAISKLKKLKILNFKHNAISELPASIVELDQLQLLDFRENPLNVLPTSFKGFKNLRQLRLQKIGPQSLHLFNEKVHRCYYQSLPQDLQQVQHLKIIDIHSSKLKELPSLQKCRELEEVNLFRCSLIKPLRFKNCLSLKKLFLKQQMLATEQQGLSCFSDQMFKQTQNLIQFNGSFNSMLFIPSSVKYLTRLVELDLCRNQIQHVCQQIGQCVSLVRLNLWCNKIRSLPNSLKNLQKLQFLSLAENQLIQINESITECVGLHELILNSNKITSLPNRMGNLINLELLDCQDNLIYCIPESMEVLKKLQPKKLIFDRNPVFLVDCPNLVLKYGSQDTKNYLSAIQQRECKIYLGSPRLQKLNPQIKRYNNLTKITINSQLLEDLPQLDSQKNLQFVQFYDNKFKKFPIYLANCFSLKHISLQKNQIVAIPGQIGQLVNLETLNLANNQVSFIHKDINNCQNLRYLNVSYNKLANIEDTVFSNLKNLVTVTFESNQLTDFPKGLIYCTKLETLEINYNCIQKISTNLKPLAALKVIHLQKNQFTEFPQQLIECQNLTQISLDHNTILEISDNLYKLSQLTSLSMNHNCLTVIPKSIGKVTSLRYLNLPNNKIQIAIKELENLTQATGFNLFNNPLKKVECRNWIMKTGTGETKKMASQIRD